MPGSSPGIATDQDVATASMSAASPASPGWHYLSNNNNNNNDTTNDKHTNDNDNDDDSNKYD